MTLRYATGAEGILRRMPSSVESLVEFVLSQARVETRLCSRQCFDTGYALEHRTVDDYNFIYTFRGEVVWVVAGHEHVMREGTLVLVRPGVPHYGFSRTQAMGLLSVHVRLTLPGGRDAMELLGPPAEMQVEEGSALERYLRGAAGEFDRPTQRETVRMLPGWGHLITHEYIAQCVHAGLLRPRAMSEVVSDLLQYLHDRPGMTVTLEELSQYAGYTPQHLNRMFRKELGTTPLKHHMRLRLERAGELLAAGQLTVGAVAQQCGFDDPAYFSRAFRTHTGHSPAQWQKAHTEHSGRSLHHDGATQR